jgi:hypothetical protein
MPNAQAQCSGVSVSRFGSPQSFCAMFLAQFAAHARLHCSPPPSTALLRTPPRSAARLPDRNCTPHSTTRLLYFTTSPSSPRTPPSCLRRRLLISLHDLRRHAATPLFSLHASIAPPPSTSHVPSNCTPSLAHVASRLTPPRLCSRYTRPSHLRRQRHTSLRTARLL